MSQHVTTLKEQPGGAMVDAIIDDLLMLDQLFIVEEQWCVTRVQVLRELTSARVDQVDWPQSVHWNWAYKAAISEPTRFDAFGDARLFGMRTIDQWQGVLFGLSDGHVTRSGAPGQPLVYVDFLESAPWNWDVPAIRRLGRYRGVGVQLMELAARRSLSLGYGGRVGLHALQQAERFYAGRCRMKNLGPDASYQDLCYFELSESDSQTFLRRTP